MSLEVDPIYHSFFPYSGNSLLHWNNFRTTNQEDADLKTWQSLPAAIKIISSVETWQETAIKISMTLLKIILFPWGIYAGCKFLANWFALSCIYPAQNLPKDQLFEWRKEAIEQRNLNGGIMRHIRLEKNGKSYSAFLIGKESTIQNGKWVLHANGNHASIEKECAVQPNYLDSYLAEDFNVLLVNGPGVGCSDSMEALEDLADSQELGLTFLETAIKAQEMILTGISLGAGAQSMVINRHAFLENRTYTVIRLWTFDRLSNLVYHLTGQLGVWLLSWLGYEIDSIKASQKLHELAIQEIIFDNDRDPLMSSVSLERGLLNEHISLENKTVQRFSFDGHYYCAHREVIQAIQDLRPEQFIAS